MGGEKDHTLSAADGFRVVFESFVAHILSDVCFIELGEMAELHEQPAQIGECAAQNAPAFGVAELRHCHPEILKTCLALPARKMKTKPRHDFSRSVGGGSRHGSEEFE